MADYYAVLGLTSAASADEIKKAYLKLARERHPDRFPDPAEKAKAQDFFKDLNAAYSTLSNERNRRDYDAQQKAPPAASPAEIAKRAYAQGLAAIEARDYHSAVEHLRVAVQHLPKEPRVHAALGRALARNPHWVREAVQCY